MGSGRCSSDPRTLRAVEGAPRPVELSADEKILLCMLLRYWDWQQRASGARTSFGTRSSPSLAAPREGRPFGLDSRALGARRRPGRVAVGAMRAPRTRNPTTTATVRSATPASRIGRRSTTTSMRAGSATTKAATSGGSAPAASTSCTNDWAGRWRRGRSSVRGGLALTRIRPMNRPDVARLQAACSGPWYASSPSTCPRSQGIPGPISLPHRAHSTTPAASRRAQRARNARCAGPYFR